MNRLITSFSTYNKLLKNKSLNRDLHNAVDFLMGAKLSLTTKKNVVDNTFILLPVSIKTIPVVLHNDINYSRIAEYDPNINIIRIFYNYYTMSCANECFSTLVHEYGHAYLYKNNINKLTYKDYHDQHEFFSQMLSTFFLAKLFPAVHNAMYVWLNINNKKTQTTIGHFNFLPVEYNNKKYYHLTMRRLFSVFLKYYKPDIEFVKIFKGHQK